MHTPNTDRRRVLIVDDNPDAATTLSLLLRTVGHQVEIAYDASSGFSLASAHLPDVAIIDLVLPQESGTQLARRMRALQGGEAVNLIALTGLNMHSSEVEAAGFNHYLLKPASLEALKQAMESRRPSLL